MKKKILVLTALKGSGKDTTGDYIVKNYQNWEKDSFAGTLKDAVSAIFSWDRKMLAGETPEDRAIREAKDEYWSKCFGYDVTPRNMLQRFGTEILRNNLHKDIWVNSLRLKVEKSEKNIIITDCRFKNEIDMLRNLGAKIVRIHRGEKPVWFDTVSKLNKSGCTPEKMLELVPELKNVHQSEWDWIGYDRPDAILDNNGTINDLYPFIDILMRELFNE